MRIVFSSRAWEQYQHWVANDRNMLERLNALIEQSCRTPFKGTGKPEPLKGEWHGPGRGGSIRRIASSTASRAPARTNG
jgi:Txe/YoeB family toxin of toxin-antitoxin system